MVVSKSIDRVVEQMRELKNEMRELNHELRQEMHEGFSSLDKRVVAIEIRLGMIDKKRKGIYDRMMDYLFKAGYGTLTLAFGYLTYLILQLHPLLK